MGALRFRLFGIPVAVSPSFWFLSLFLQLSELARPMRLAVWLAVVFSGVLLHELGHALVIRAFGFAPSIELYGMGGLTAWAPQGGAPSAGKRLLVSLAGPVAGISFGVGTLFLGLASGLSFDGIQMRLSLAEYLVASIVWVNAGWGLLNLIPVYPLDGGQVVASLFDLVLPGRGRLWALRVTILVGALVCAAALAARAPIGAAMAAFFVFQAVMGLRAEGKRGAEASLLERLAAARAALDAGDLERARVLGEGVRAEARTPVVTASALELLAWIAVAAHDHGRAAQLLASLPEGFEADPLLGGIVDFEHGHYEHAAAAFTRELAARPAPEVAARLCEALARGRWWDRLLAAMTDPRVEALLPDSAYAALVAETHGEGGFDAAAVLGERLFGRTGTARDAFNVACSLARTGRADDAFGWLARAAGVGGLTRAHVAGDEDLASLRGRAGWPDALARFPAGPADASIV